MHVITSEQVSSGHPDKSCTTSLGIYGNEVNPAVGTVRMMIVAMAVFIFPFETWHL